MPDDFRINRHIEVADETAKSMKRICLAGLVFGSFILYNVLAPYSENFDKSQGILKEVEEKKAEIAEKYTALSEVQLLSKAVAQVEETVQGAPWQRHKNKLIATYSSIKGTAGATREHYQDLANETVNAIAEDVKAAISPLDQTLISNPDLKKTLPQIEAMQADLSDSIETWRTQKWGKEWYGTIAAKNETVNAVNADVEGRVADMGAQVKKEIGLLSTTLKNAEDEIQADLNNKKVEVEAKKVELDKLEEKMRTVLPSWVPDRIGIEEMVQAFPLIVFGIAMYLLFSGVSLTRHHQEAARARLWTPEEQQDPLYSSPWTLIYRGPSGTTNTVFLYTAVFVVSWIFVKEGGDILLKWLATANEPLVSESLYRPAVIGMYVALAAGLGCVLLCTWKSFVGHEKSSER